MADTADTDQPTVDPATEPDPAPVTGDPGAADDTTDAADTDGADTDGDA